MTPYYSDPGVTLWHGDALGVLRGLDDGSVDCIVTSPPYYVTALVAALREARRVLADDGTLWLNLGDSYSGGGAGGGGKHATIGQGIALNSRNSRQHYERLGLGPKNLLGIPWRVALALQDDGWVLRNDIIWAKPNAMPESVTDRLAGRYEHVFLLTKSGRYHFDLDAIRQPHAETTIAAASRARTPYTAPGQRANLKTRSMNDNGANPGDVWTIPTAPFAGAHFATMPPALAERCILAGCKPGGTVLDPFSGSGTTGLAAAKHGHPYVGIDLNADYLDMSLRTRLQQPGLDLEGLTA